MTAHTCKIFILRAFAAIAASLVTSAFAQTWTGGGTDDNWSNGANWSGGVPPASGPGTQVTVVGTSIVDMPWTLNRITTNGNTNVSGQPITLAGATPGILGITVNVFATPIVLTGAAGISSLQVIDLTGGISGTGPLSLTAVVGIGLYGTNTYTGGTTVGVGNLVLHGSMLGPLTILGPGAALLGGGTVNGPVIVNTGGFIGANLIGGSVTTGDLSVAGGFQSRINGPAAGQYGSIRVNGTVTLTNATLTLSGAYVPAEGDVFILIDNDGSDPVVGTFAGLPEGGILVVNGVPRRLSYVGGSGNDVTLGPTALGAVREAPTLSEWALILLSALMLGVGMLQVRRRH
jgi:hypothetical protein